MICSVNPAVFFRGMVEVAEDVEGVAEDVQRVVVEHVENQEGRSDKFYTRSTIRTNKI